jgi:hypothetical protein
LVRITIGNTGAIIIEMDVAAQFPIIPHESAGVECEGCIITETFETARAGCVMGHEGHPG